MSRIESVTFRRNTDQNLICGVTGGYVSHGRFVGVLPPGSIVSLTGAFSPVVFSRTFAEMWARRMVWHGYISRGIAGQLEDLWRLQLVMSQLEASETQFLRRGFLENHVWCGQL